MDTPVFSFFMGNVDTEAPNNGVLTLGGVNQTHYEGDRSSEPSSNPSISHSGDRVFHPPAVHELPPLCVQLIYLKHLLFVSTTTM